MWLLFFSSSLFTCMCVCVISCLLWFHPFRIIEMNGKDNCHLIPQMNHRFTILSMQWNRDIRKWINFYNLFTCITIYVQSNVCMFPVWYCCELNSYWMGNAMKLAAIRITRYHFNQTLSHCCRHSNVKHSRVPLKMFMKIALESEPDNGFGLKSNKCVKR